MLLECCMTGRIPLIFAAVFKLKIIPPEKLTPWVYQQLRQFPEITVMGEDRLCFFDGYSIGLLQLS